MKFENDYIVFCAEMAYNETMMEHIAMAPIGINLLNEGVGDILSSVKNWIKGLFVKFMNFLKTVKEKFMNLFRKKKQQSSEKKKEGETNSGEKKTHRKGVFVEDDGVLEYIYPCREVELEISKLKPEHVIDSFYTEFLLKSDNIDAMRRIILDLAASISDGNLGKTVNDKEFNDLEDPVNRMKRHKIKYTEHNMLVAMGFPLVRNDKASTRSDIGLMDLFDKKYNPTDAEVEDNEKKKSGLSSKFDAKIDEFDKFPTMMDNFMKETKKKQDEIMKALDSLSNAKIVKTGWEGKASKSEIESVLPNHQNRFNETMKNVKESLSTYVSSVSELTGVISKACVKAVSALTYVKKQLQL